MPRPIYFSGSISAGREDVVLYQRIVAGLEAAGHRVFAGMVTNAAIPHSGEERAPAEIFTRDMAWLEEVARDKGVLVAEISKASLGVGYEIATARYRFGIDVVCLWRPAYTSRCSAMIAGDAAIKLIEYHAFEHDAGRRLLAAIG